MSHSRRPSPVPPSPSANYTPEKPRLRKRLQKKLPSLRRPAPIDSSASNKLSTAVGLVAQHAGTVGQPSLHLSPDLSDAKWHEYLHNNNNNNNNGKTKAEDLSNRPEALADQPALSSPPELIPEFSHLAVSSSYPRPSFESSMSSPTSSISTRSSMRRRAKTPVYTIGQLESTPCVIKPVTVDRSSVDLIAQQYQALIESQDASSIHVDEQSDLLPSQQTLYTRPPSTHSHCGSDELPTELRPSTYQPPPQQRANSANHSPASDDGTLVAFDEEAIYFKPLSFSSEPPTPPPRSRARVERNAEPPPTDHNLSLQICTDLLTRELSTAMLERPHGSGEDISSLQIWVMIEAYERLRDLVRENEGAHNLEPIFETWLAALYSLHNKLTNDANSHESHYDVACLNSEDLD
ncbi:uncharacterized protein CTRU02_211041 [Colletotrichum truncatum]|uniref:Uncharacterized protein n=1 Tax=Colletotrichum truncatum TaxID=5467 RepID=A0ACC3YQW0_COLTU|nr:uncharacterized protein CTRU02_01821 [Colletotrichum truncatum]KAF6798950.1 hypothetical protein CTRU02_01821 [Colletotrichum truncatum]